MNAHLKTDRFIPYAKDHDRLQLALLYLEDECNRYENAVARLEILRQDEENIRKSLENISNLKEAKIKEYIHERHPAKYIDSTGQLDFPDIESQTTQSKEEPGESHDQGMEHIFIMERCEVKALDAILKRIKYFEEEQEILREYVAQREEIVKLIEELHSTAFDGDTPEFPHEDQLEARAQVARIVLKDEQAALDKLHREDGLVELAKIAHMAHLALNALNEISVVVDEVCRRLDRERALAPGLFLLEEFLKFKIPDRCKTAVQRCQAWKEGIDNHFSEHPDTILSPRARTMIPQIDPKELVEVASMDSSAEDATHRIAALLSDAKQARREVRVAITTTELMKGQAAKNVRKAKTILELRRRELAAARTQILDHVVDPENCPLEQRAEELPDYPEQIAIHGLSESHPLVSRLLAESETYSVENYVNDIVHSRLYRIRRTTHPPVLLTSRYQPPTYDELDDPELLTRHYQRDVPPIDGDTTPEDSEEPVYEGMIRMEPSKLSSIVQEELDKTVSTARQQLSQKDNITSTEMVRALMDALEGSDMPLIMPGPGARF
ncbi:hypothetical protein FRC11_009349 [Ceratobasidium sp. 423]|nr:hypothetical protein FRC11_009349 [Ceratobasidium sp. 423]